MAVCTLVTVENYGMKNWTCVAACSVQTFGQYPTKHLMNVPVYTLHTAEHYVIKNSASVAVCILKTVDLFFFI